MFELLYTSISSAGLSEAELIKILEKARLKNKTLNITGMLVYHDREIMQILEGEERSVKDLYQIICEDERHSSVETLFQGDIEHRAFPRWSMAFKSLNEHGFKEILALDGYEEFGENASPISIIKTSKNRGKKTFLSLRDRL